MVGVNSGMPPRRVSTVVDHRLRANCNDALTSLEGGGHSASMQSDHDPHRDGSVRVKLVTEALGDLGTWGLGDEV